MVTNLQRAISERDKDCAQALARLMIKRVARDEVGRAEKRILVMIREIGVNVGRLMEKKKKGVNKE